MWALYKARVETNVKRWYLMLSFLSINIIIIMNTTPILNQLGGGGRVLKSGCDFREFGHVVVSFDGGCIQGVSMERVEVNSEVPENPQVKVLVNHFMGGWCWC